MRRTCVVRSVKLEDNDFTQAETWRGSPLTFVDLSAEEITFVEKTFSVVRVSKANKTISNSAAWLYLVLSHPSWPSSQPPQMVLETGSSILTPMVDTTNTMGRCNNNLHVRHRLVDEFIRLHISSSCPCSVGSCVCGPYTDDILCPEVHSRQEAFACLRTVPLASVLENQRCTPRSSHTDREVGCLEANSASD